MSLGCEFRWDDGPSVAAVSAALSCPCGAITEMWDAAREFIEAQRSDSVPTRVKARERLLAALEATR